MRLKISILLIQLLSHGFVCSSGAFNESENEYISENKDNMLKHSFQEKGQDGSTLKIEDGEGSNLLTKRSLQRENKINRYAYDSYGGREDVYDSPTNTFSRNRPDMQETVYGPPSNGRENTINRGRAQVKTVYDKSRGAYYSRGANYYYAGAPLVNQQVITSYPGRIDQPIAYTTSRTKGSKNNKAQKSTGVVPGTSIQYVQQPGNSVQYVGQPGNNVQYITQPGTNVQYITQPGYNVQYVGQPGNVIQYVGRPGSVTYFPTYQFPATGPSLGYGPPPTPGFAPAPAPAPGSGIYSPTGTKCLSRATRFMFQFTPTSCAASKTMNLQGPKFVYSLDTPLMSPSLIKFIGENSMELFSGMLSFYDTLEISSSQGFDSVIVQIWKPDATQILQAFEFRLSCDDPLLLGDSYCGLTVTGFQNVPQGLVQMQLPGSSNPSPNTGVPVSPIPNTGGPGNPNLGTGVQCTDNPSQLKLKVTGDTCGASSNNQGINFSCTDYQPITFPAHVTISSVDNLITYFQGVVQNKNEIVVIGDSIQTLADRMTVITRSADQLQIKQLFSFATDCNVELALQNTFGSVQLVQFKNLNQGEFFCCMMPATASPTNTPTNSPTSQPTTQPTNLPTNSPTNPPTNIPTRSPTNTPTRSPTNTPTRSPTNAPTRTPTKTPTKFPTRTPTSNPSSNPSVCATKCTSFSCQYSFELLANGDCNNSDNDQVSPYFSCQIDNSLTFPVTVKVFDEKFTTTFHTQTVSSGGEIVTIGDENLCSPAIGVQIESSGGSLDKVFTINTSCETQPIRIGDTFSSFKVVSFTNDEQGTVTCNA